MTDRDHFAAAALTGLLVHAKDGIDEETLDTPSDIAYTAYAMADAMLRERCRAGADCPLPDNAPNHDAAPAARGDARECASPVTTGGKPAIDRLREWERHGSGRWGLGAAGDVTMLERRLAMVEEIVHDAAPAARAGTAGTGDTQLFDAYRRFVGEVMNWISEATSAADWSSDGGRKIMADACSRCWDAFDRIAYPTLPDNAPPPPDNAAKAPDNAAKAPDIAEPVAWAVMLAEITASSRSTARPRSPTRSGRSC